MKKHLKFCVLITIATLAAAGCATVEPYDYSAINATKPRSIVVIPPLNHSIELEASYTFLATISKPLAEKGYYVFPVAVIDIFLKENGLPTPGEMNNVSLDKIAENIGADAVLFIEINNWGQKYQIFSSKAVVDSRLKLVDVKTGDLLWDAEAYAEQTSDDGNSGLLGALIGAITEQIIGNLVDRTQQLSRQANQMAIDHTTRGLPKGPYALIDSSR